MKLYLCFFCLFALYPIFSLAQETKPPISIKVSGTGSALGAIEKLSKGFSKMNVQFKIDILPSLGTSGAIKAVIENALDIGIIGRELKDSEKNEDFNVIYFAKSPFIIIANSNVSDTEITSAQLISFLKGTLLEWPKGGKARPILRPKSDVDSEIIRSVSQDITSAYESALKKEGMLIATTNQECNALVEKTNGAFSFSTLTQVLTEEINVKWLTWDNQTPLKNKKANPQYPIFKKLYLIFKKSKTENVNLFIKFIESPEGQKILKESGLVIEK